MKKLKLAIHVAWSPLSQRFYAFRAFKRVNKDTIEVTGEKFDVTDEIALAILKYNIEFKEKGEKTYEHKPVDSFRDK